MAEKHRRANLWREIDLDTETEHEMQNSTNEEQTNLWFYWENLK